MKSHFSLRLSAAVLSMAAMVSAPSALGDILASESFESYNPGALSSQTGGGTGWPGNWTAPGAVVRADVVDTTAAPMAFTPLGGLTINGETRALEVQLSGNPASQLAGVRTLATPIAQTFYVGYLVRYARSGTWAGANNTFTLHLGTNATQTGTLNFGIRGDASGGGTANEFVIRFGTGTPVSGATTGGQVVNGTDYYVVARMNYAGGLFTSANMWLNPSATDNLDTPGGDASLTFTTSFANPISHVLFREAVLDADDVLRADELKLGTIWGDIVTIPEPSAAILLLFGCLGSWQSGVGLELVGWREPIPSLPSVFVSRRLTVSGFLFSGKQVRRRQHLATAKCRQGGAGIAGKPQEINAEAHGLAPQSSVDYRRALSARHRFCPRLACRSRSTPSPHEHGESRLLPGPVPV